MLCTGPSIVCKWLRMTWYVVELKIDLEGGIVSFCKEEGWSKQQRHGKATAAGDGCCRKVVLPPPRDLPGTYLTSLLLRIN